MLGPQYTTKDTPLAPTKQFRYRIVLYRHINEEHVLCTTPPPEGDTTTACHSLDRDIDLNYTALYSGPL